MTFWMVFVVVVGILVLRQGSAKRSGACDQGHDDCPARSLWWCWLSTACSCPGQRKGFLSILVPDFDRMQEVGVVNTLVCRYESGILHPEPWHRCHVHLRQLYWQGTLSAGRVCPYRGAGYLRSHHRRSDHFPGLLYLPCGPDQRSQPDLYHPAQHLCQYVHGSAVGQPVLFVHGLCSPVHRAGSVRKYHLLRHGTDRLQPQKVQSGEPRAHHPAVHALRAGL